MPPNDFFRIPTDARAAPAVRFGELLCREVVAESFLRAGLPGKLFLNVSPSLIHSPAFADDEIFGSRVIAEGIETSGEFMIVRDLGIAMGQGYFIARPAPVPPREPPPELQDLVRAPRCSWNAGGWAASDHGRRLLAPPAPVLAWIPRL